MFFLTDHMHLVSCIEIILMNVVWYIAGAFIREIRVTCNLPLFQLV